jgi:hypothetical protein
VKQCEGEFQRNGTKAPLGATVADFKRDGVSAMPLTFWQFGFVVLAVIKVSATDAGIDYQEVNETWVAACHAVVDSV